MTLSITTLSTTTLTIMALDTDGCYAGHCK
jgi:hypothetical protein